MRSASITASSRLRFFFLSWQAASSASHRRLSPREATCRPACAKAAGLMSGSHGRARSVLAAGEIALAIVLLVGAGLLVRSFTKLTAVRPGFDPEHTVKAEISLPQFQDEAAPVDRLRRRAAGRCPDGAWADERGARCAHAARRRFRESRLRHRRRPAASRWRIAAGELRVCQSRIFSSDGYPARIGSHILMSTTSFQPLASP